MKKSEELPLHERIMSLLSQGEEVFSCAAGRVGRITRADEESIYITFRDVDVGVTTFNIGDAVYLETIDGKHRVLNVKSAF